MLVVSQKDFEDSIEIITYNNHQYYVINVSGKNYFYNEWYTGNITDMSYFFQDKPMGSSWNTDEADVTGWNVSNVENMEGMFYDNPYFNQDIGDWDVSNALNMSHMFHGAKDFNQDISYWDVSSVLTMNSMFEDAYDFNQDIGYWNVSNVQDMSNMFNYANAFNKALNRWDVSNVTNMSRMFYKAHNFDQNLDSWDVSSVTDMRYMFRYANRFDGEIGSWDVSNVTHMDRMFADAWDFNRAIGSWDVSNVTNMSYLFDNVYDFNQDIGNWDVSNVHTMQGMFDDARSFNRDIGNWNVSNVTTMSSMFRGASAFNTDIGLWNVGEVTDMGRMFGSAASFDQDLSGWDVRRISSEPTGFDSDTLSTWVDSEKPVWGTDGGSVLSSCFVEPDQASYLGSSGPCDGLMVVSQSDFDSVGSNDRVSTFAPSGGDETFRVSGYPPELWYTANITDMSSYFSDTSFDGPIGNWDVSNVVSMERMFYRAKTFNQDIGGWDVSNVEDMSIMFHTADEFNSDIGNWNVSSVQQMDYMFGYARDFNQDIGNWDVSSAVNMYFMFGDTVRFNQDIGEWDVSNVEDMTGMFAGSRAFNTDIADWDVGAVTSMWCMFCETGSFNQDIGRWDVRNVENMTTMFSGASKFDQDISAWDVAHIPDKPNNFDKNTLSSWLMKRSPSGEELRVIMFPPCCRGRSHRMGQRGSPLDADLSLTFDEAIGLGTGTIGIYAANDSVEGASVLSTSSTDSNPVETYDVTASDAITISDETLTIDRSASFEYGTSYYVLVDSGAITDLAGNAFADLTSSDEWTFSTEPWPISAVNSLVSADPSEDLSLEEVSIITVDLRDGGNAALSGLADLIEASTSTSTSSVDSFTEVESSGVYTAELTSTDWGIVEVIVTAAGVELDQRPTISYTGPPGIPTDFVAEQGDGSLKLSWQAPADTGSSALIDYEVSLDGGFSFTSTGGTATTYEVTGLTNGTTYSVQVRAVNSERTGEATDSIDITPAASNAFSAYTGVCEPIFHDQDPNVELGGSGTLTSSDSDGSYEWTGTLTFTFSSPLDLVLTPNSKSNLSSFDAGGAYVTDGGAWVQILGDSSVSYGLSADGQSLLGSGTGALASADWGHFDSAGVTSLTLTSGGLDGDGLRLCRIPEVPEVPTDLTVTPEADQITLTWQAPLDDGGPDISDYEYSLNGTDLIPMAGTYSVDGTGLISHTISDIVSGQAYDITVQARNAVGLGAATASINVPAVSLSSTAGQYVSQSFEVTATFSAAVTGFDTSSVTVGNGTVSSWVSGSDGDATYVFEVTPTSDGTVSVDVEANVVGNTASNQLTRIYDTTGPTFDDDGDGDDSRTSFTVAENVFAVGTLGVTDASGAALSFAIIGGVDGEDFVIDPDTGALSFSIGANGEAADYEAPADDDGNNEYILEVSVTDQAEPNPNVSTQTVIVTVTNVLENATLSLSSDAVQMQEDADTPGTFSLALGEEPMGDVVVTVAPGASNGINNLSLDWGGEDAFATFTIDNWQDVQTIQVVTDENNQSLQNGEVTLDLIAAGGGYDTISAQKAVVVINTTDPSMTFSATSITIDEGGQDSFTVVLDAQPTDAVTLTLASDDPDAVGVSPTTLSFTTANWDVAQTVTVEGVQDGDTFDEFDIEVSVNAADGGYDGLSATLEVDVIDDDYVVPDAPTGLFVEPLDGQLSLSWTEPAYDGGDAIVGYRVQLDDGTSVWTVDTGSVATQAIVDIDNGRAYTVSVAAVNAAGVGAYSDPAYVPAVSLSSAAGQYVSQSFEVTATFSAAVTGFSSDGVTVGNGIVSSWVSGSDGDTTYVFEVMPIVEGTVSVDVEANAAQNTAAIQLTRIYDTTAPVFSDDGDGDDSRTSFTVAENVFAVGTLGASDSTGSSVTYAISGGVDSEDFAIDPDTGALSFSIGANGEAADYEAPADDDGNNEYILEVSVSDEADPNPNVSTQTVIVTVTNVLENAVLSVSSDAVQMQEDANTPGTFSLALGEEPVGDVIVTVVPGASNGINNLSLDWGGGDAFATFTIDNWQDVQTIQVMTDVNDQSLQNGEVTLELIATGGGYDTISAQKAVEVINTTAPGMTVSESSIELDEGGQDSFTLVLDAQPTDAVTLSPCLR